MEQNTIEQKIQEFVCRNWKKKTQMSQNFTGGKRSSLVTVIPFIETKEEYRGMKLLERMAEPERVIIFRVPW